jgi:hypothetical protein
MAVLRMPFPWLRPEDRKFYLRARVPAALVPGAGKKLHRIPLHTRDPSEAKARFPDALSRWEMQKAEWRRLGNRVELTLDAARDIAAQWFDAIARDASLDRDGIDAPNPYHHPRTEAKHAQWRAFWARVQVHAEDALRVAGLSVAEGSRDLFLQVFCDYVFVAYWGGDLLAAGVCRPREPQPASMAERPSAPEAGSSSIGPAVRPLWRLPPRVRGHHPQDRGSPPFRCASFWNPGAASPP